MSYKIALTGKICVCTKDALEDKNHVKIWHWLSGVNHQGGVEMRTKTFALLMTSTMLAVSGQAFAQDSDSGAADAPETSDSIVVTGTRIVRDGYTAPTPVTVASTEDLAKSTPSNIPDALNKLPQFQNSLSPGKSANNFSAIPIHGNVLNLRGLGTPTANPKGPLRTLILADGIRVPPTTYVGTVDTNVIPNLLVERVDVVTGGASAAWGSDAVAGVVNFVLDKDFVGIKGQAQAGIDQRGDNANQRLGLAYGTEFGGGRGHLLLSGEYYNNDGMLRSDRAVGRESWTYVGSNANCVNTTTDPTACSPGGSLNPFVAMSNVLIAGNNDVGIIKGSSVAGFPYTNYVYNGDGTFSPFDSGTATGTPGFSVGGDGYTIPADTAAIAPYKTYQGFGRLSYDVSDNVNAYVQGIYSRTEMSYDALGNSLVTPVNLYKGNPYLPADIDALLTTTDDYISFGQYSPENPKPRANETTDFWMGTLGFDAEFGGWKANVSYTHGESIHNVAQSGLYDQRNLYAAVDVVTDPSTGNPTCRVLLDPTYAAAYAGCLPLNVLAGAPSISSPDAYDWVTGTSRYRAKLKHDSIVGTISGSPFELPAGPVDVVLGAEWRKQSLSLTSNADPATLSALDAPVERAEYFAGLRGVPGSVLYYWLMNVGVADGSETVKEVFGEIAVPILADTPGFEELSVNGAVRLTDYESSGSVTTWKVGGSWRPVSDLLLRATYSRDIRAPNLYELYRGDTSGIGIVLDPVTNINFNIPTVSGGNPDLEPEVAKTLSFGAVVSPSFLPGFSLSVDYYSIKLDKAIDSLSAQQIVDNCYTYGDSAPTCSLISRPSPTEFPTLVRIAEANVASLETAGIDIDATYRTFMGEDSALTVRLYANYLDKFTTQLTPDQPVLHYEGVSFVGSNPVGYPRWRGSLMVDYTNGPFGVTLSEQYIHSIRRGRPGQTENFVDAKVPAIWYTDLSLRYTVEQGSGEFEFFTTVNNLFDKDPPLVPGTVPGVNLPTNIALYDVIGRSYTAGVRFKF